MNKLFIIFSTIFTSVLLASPDFSGRWETKDGKDDWCDCVTKGEPPELGAFNPSSWRVYLEMTIDQAADEFKITNLRAVNQVKIRHYDFITKIVGSKLLPVWFENPDLSGKNWLVDSYIDDNRFALKMNLRAPKVGNPNLYERIDFRRHEDDPNVAEISIAHGIYDSSCWVRATVKRTP